MSIVVSTISSILETLIGCASGNEIFVSSIFSIMSLVAAGSGVIPAGGEGVSNSISSTFSTTSLTTADSGVLP